MNTHELYLIAIIPHELIPHEKIRIHADFLAVLLRKETYFLHGHRNHLHHINR